MAWDQTPADALTSGESLSGGNINKLADLTEFVPNLSMAETGVSTQLYIRGIGSGSTLTLLNGRRMAPHPISMAENGVPSLAVNINSIPRSLIDRVEILRDGASSIYGSDAIGGVVNFITKKDFQGLEVGASYKHVADSDGDYNMNFTYGWVGDRANVLIAGGWDHRSVLSAQDRDWANKGYLDGKQMAVRVN